MIPCLIAFLCLLVTSCWTDADSNAGIMVTGNTIANGDTAQINYGAGTKDLSGLKQLLRNGLETHTLRSMDQLSVQWMQDDWIGWDFAEFQPKGQISTLPYSDTAKYLGIPVWSSIQNGSVLVNPQTLITLAHTPFAGKNKLEIAMQIFPQSFDVGTLLIAWEEGNKGSSLNLKSLDAQHLELSLAVGSTQHKMVFTMPSNQWTMLKLILGSDRYQVSLSDSIVADAPSLSNWTVPKAEMFVGGKSSSNPSTKPLTALIDFLALKANPEMLQCWAIDTLSPKIYSCPKLARTDSFFAARYNKYEWNSTADAAKAQSLLARMRLNLDQMQPGVISDTIQGSLDTAALPFFYSMCSLPAEVLPINSTFEHGDSIKRQMIWIDSLVRPYLEESDLKTPWIHNHRQGCKLPNGDSLSLQGLESNGQSGTYSLKFQQGIRSTTISLSITQFLRLLTPNP